MTNLYTGRRGSPRSWSREKPPADATESVGLTTSGRSYRTINLAALVRQIAFETVDEQTQETRIEAAVRGMFNEARKNPAAFREITERGWGRVPIPVNVTLVGAGLIEHAANLGLKPEHVLADPTLLALFRDGGVEIVEGEFKIVEIGDVI